MTKMGMNKYGWLSVYIGLALLTGLIVISGWISFGPTCKNATPPPFSKLNYNDSCVADSDCTTYPYDLSVNCCLLGCRPLAVSKQKLLYLEKLRIEYCSGANMITCSYGVPIRCPQYSCKKAKYEGKCINGGCMVVET